MCAHAGVYRRPQTHASHTTNTPTCHTRTHICMHAHVHTHTYSHTHMHTCTGTQTHTHIFVHTPTYSQMHACTHTHSQTLSHTQHTTHTQRVFNFCCDILWLPLPLPSLCKIPSTILDTWQLPFLLYFWLWAWALSTEPSLQPAPLLLKSRAFSSGNLMRFLASFVYR